MSSSKKLTKILWNINIKAETWLIKLLDMLLKAETPQW
jgi:hypothetical protein